MLVFRNIQQKYKKKQAKISQKSLESLRILVLMQMRKFPFCLLALRGLSTLPLSTSLSLSLTE